MVYNSKIKKLPFHFQYTHMINLEKKRTKPRFNRLYVAQALLILSDLLWFNLGPAIATGLIWFYFGEIDRFLLLSELPIRITSQFILSILCVAWLWIWRRHYSKRVAFGFELKDIILTLAFRSEERRVVKDF